MIRDCKLLTTAMSLVFFIGFFNVASAASEYNLLLIKLPDKEVVLKFLVNGGDRFYIDYIHSKDKTPVHDIFLISEQGKLILLEEHYEWYGAGLAFHPEGKGQIIFENDRTRVLLNRELDQFLLRVGRIANHTLNIKSKSIPLISIANGGDLIEFVVEINTEGEDNDN
jgi:hypothetical protein